MTPSLLPLFGESAENALDLMQGQGPTTDAEGNFTVRQLGAGSGEVYFIDPEAKDFSMIATQSFKLSPGESKDIGEIRGTIAIELDEEE